MVRKFEQIVNIVPPLEKNCKINESFYTQSWKFLYTEAGADIKLMVLEIGPFYLSINLN